MSNALLHFSFKGIGFATNWDQLTKLKIPVILYVKQRNQDHFTVISGISDTHVKLSDPSYGNKILTKGQFKKIWETRNSDLKGKALAVLPLNQDKKMNISSNFFHVPKVSRVPYDLLFIRRF